MATPHTPLSRPWDYPATPFDSDFSIVDVPIGGKLIQAKLELSPAESMTFQSDDDYKRAIKQKIASELAQAMLDSRVIEFTRLPQNPIGNDIIYARCYLAPDASVKILRMQYVKPDKR